MRACRPQLQALRLADLGPVIPNVTLLEAPWANRGGAPARFTPESRVGRLCFVDPSS